MRVYTGILSLWCYGASFICYADYINGRINFGQAHADRVVKCTVVILWAFAHIVNWYVVMYKVHKPHIIHMHTIYAIEHHLYKFIAFSTWLYDQCKSLP